MKKELKLRSFYLSVMRMNMHRLTLIISIVMCFFFSKDLVADDIYIFQTSLKLPEKCIFIVNNKTFSCEEQKREYTTVQFSTPEESSRGFDEVKSYSKSHEAERRGQKVITKTSDFSGKKHFLLIFKEEGEKEFYDYKICGEKNCIRVSTFHVERIFSILKPIANKLIPMDE